MPKLEQPSTASKPLRILTICAPRTWRQDLRLIPSATQLVPPDRIILSLFVHHLRPNSTPWTVWAPRELIEIFHVFFVQLHEAFYASCNRMLFFGIFIFGGGDSKRYSFLGDGHSTCEWAQNTDVCDFESSYSEMFDTVHVYNCMFCPPMNNGKHIALPHSSPLTTSCFTFPFLFAEQKVYKLH